MQPPLPHLGIRHLALIAAIDDLRQVSLAAARLGMTQPAASRLLAEAEARVGAPLFDRGPKGMAPTAPGDALARRARNILDEMRAAGDEVDRLRQGRGGILRIGAVTGAAVGYVVPVIARLKAEVPEVEIHVEVAASDALMAGLRARRHDMVLARVPAGMALDGLILRPARGETVRIVARADHPAAGQGAVALADLSAGNWVMQGPGTPIRRAVEEAFQAEAAALPRNVTNTTSLLMAMALLREPGTLTAVSAEVADVLTGTRHDLVVLAVRPIHVPPYALVTLRDRRLSPAAARAAEMLAKRVAGAGDGSV